MVTENSDEATVEDVAEKAAAGEVKDESSDDITYIKWLGTVILTLW